jgi:hypothetical protein
MIPLSTSGSVAQFFDGRLAMPPMTQMTKTTFQTFRTHVILRHRGTIRLIPELLSA